MKDLKFAIISNRRENLENIIKQLDLIEDITFEICVVYQGYDKIEIETKNKLYIKYLDPKESKQGNEVRFAYLRNETVKLGTETRFIMIMDDDGKVLYKYTPILKRAIEECSNHSVLKGYYISSTLGLIHPLKLRVPYLIPSSTRGIMLPYKIMVEALNNCKDIPGINEDVFVALYAMSKGIWFYAAPGPISAKGQIYNSTAMDSSMRNYIKEYFKVDLPDIFTARATPKREASYANNGNTTTLKDLIDTMLKTFNNQVEEQYKNIMLKGKDKYEIKLPPYNGIEHKN